MKPYVLALYNRIRVAVIHLRGLSFQANGIQLFGWNTKLCFQHGSKICFGERLITDGRFVVVADSDSEIVIGARTYFNEGCMLSAKSRIEIGSCCQFGPNVSVFDNNHKYDSANGVSHEHTTNPIKIGKNCWIGANAVILKGADIGDNCVIGAGCVVSGTIPEASIVTQNRDLVVRPIEK